MEDMIPCSVKDQEVFQRVWQRVMAGRSDESSPIQPGIPGGWEGDQFDFFTDEGRAAADVDFNGEPIEKGLRKELFDFSQKLFQWRKNADVIHNGKTMHFVPTNEGYGYFRYNDNDVVFVFINPSETETITVPWSNYAEIAADLGEGTDVLTGEKVTVTDATQVAPLQFLLIQYKK